MKKFDLYFKPSCPYCMKVLNFMQEERIFDYNNYNITDGRAGEENKKALIEIGGKNQVPCIVVDGKAMYESDDIIAYLKENK